MSDQASDRLTNDHPRVQLDGLRLYGVVCGDVRTAGGWGGEPYPFGTPPTLPSDNTPLQSFLHRGYVAHYRLHADGQIELLSYRYLVGFAGDRRNPEGIWEEQGVREFLTGDFWLVMKPAFRAPRTYVPFRSGRIVEDPANWYTEPECRFWRAERRGSLRVNPHQCPYCHRSFPEPGVQRCPNCRTDWSGPDPD